MKNVFFIGLAMLLTFTSCKKEEIMVNALTEKEKVDLIFLRQEEKLAHDVYVNANGKYAHFIFNNISNSEQTHIDHVIGLLEKYQIEDPAASLGVGIFQDEQLQSLYHTLIAKVDLSLVDALEVGATIEDLDIFDIDRFKANTIKEDILKEYDLLTCGSRNHIRGFTSQLKLIDKTYVPQFLSQTTFDNILKDSHENCNQ